MTEETENSVETVPQIDNDFVAGDAGPILCCPRCGSKFMHQRYVETYARSGEDSDKGIAVSVDINANESHTDTDVGAESDNPSRRRNGIRIGFNCEQCEGGNELVIEQHKGNEFIHWVSDSAD